MIEPDASVGDCQMFFLAQGMDVDLIGMIAASWLEYWLQQGKTPLEIYQIAMAHEFPRPVSDATGFDTLGTGRERDK